MNRFLMIALAAVVSLTGSLKARSQQPPATDSLADNGALAYWQAFVLLPKLDDDLNSARQEALSGGPVDDKLIEILKSADEALRQFHRGANMSRCVWGVDTDAAIEAPLPHLAQAREMARFACLRARVRFDQQQGAAAIDDLAATMTLARHVGSDGLIVSLLVGYTIEDMAIQMAALNLRTLKADGPERLSQCIVALPRSKNMGYAIRMEKELLLGWLIRELSKPGSKTKVLQLLQSQNDPNLAILKDLSAAELVAGLVELRAIYDQLIEMMSLSPDRLDEAMEKLSAESDLSQPAKSFASLILPAVGKMRRAEAGHQVRLAMLQAAIAVVRGDETALMRKDLQDPFGSGPFSYNRRDGRFELVSKLIDRNGNPLTLTIGRTP